MSKIVYYPVCYDVFIGSGNGSDYPKIHSGVSYFLIDKNKHTEKEIQEVCKVNKTLNNTWVHHGEYIETLYDEKINNITTKIKDECKSYFKPQKYGIEGKLNVGICSMFSWGGFLNSKGQTLSLIEPYIWINIDNITNSMVLKTCTNKNEASSLISYINTRLVRFLTFISCTSQNINNDTTWRFVPDPINFDHIFTDAELYEKYGLTQEEIDIIESVIKERK